MELKDILKQSSLIVLMVMGFLSVSANKLAPLDQPLSSLLELISEEYEVIITYNERLLSNINVQFELNAEERLESAVNRVLRTTDLQYKQLTGKYYVVYKEDLTNKKNLKEIKQKFEQIEKLKKEENLSIQSGIKQDKRQLIGSIFESARKILYEKTITGTVTDPEGTPLIGATILVKNSNVGTTTDIDGTYSISVPDDATTLVISFIGYGTQEVEIAGRSVIDVQMAEDLTQLDEIVVVGYGSKKKVNLIGAVSTVTSEDIASQSLTSAGQALAGRVPGVQIIQGSAQPGQDNPIMQIRGVSTIRTSVGAQNDDTSPLVIVDGIQSTMNDVHPQDIESISVIKDASSAAIYGARAGNGVILITTKRGKNAKPKISINSYLGWQSPTFIPETLNPYEYALLRNESRTNVGREPDYDAATLDWFKNYKHESWADFIYKEGAPLMNHHISVSGGNNSVRYMVSGGFQDHEGVLINTDSKRYNIRSNLDVTVSDKVRAGLNLAASFINSNQPTVGFPNFGATMLVRNAIRHPPFALVDGVIKPDGFYSSGTRGFATHTGITVADAVVGGMDNEKIYRATPSLYFEYEPIENLVMKAAGSVFVQSGRTSAFAAPYFVSDGEQLFPRNGLGQLTESNDFEITTLFEATAIYNKQLGNSEISALVGFSDQTFESDFLQARNQGYPSDAVQKLDAGSISPTVWGSGQEWALRSGFARVGYTYNDKYLAEFNIRYDGSSRFGSSNRWGVFPSLSLGWRVSQEAFMQDVDFIDNLKLRANWGQLGNQNIGNYRHVSTIALDQAYIFNNAVAPGAAATSIPNPDIQWETTTMTDVGVDVGLFDNRFSIEADYYVKITDNILLTPPVPKTLGNLSPPAQNQGKVENRGFEILVNYFGNIGRDFNYSVSANWGHNDNEVLELDKEFISANKIITRVGEPISSYYGHRILGIFSTDAEAQDVDTYGQQPGGATHAAGDYIFADENGDGVVNADDRVIIGNTNIRNTVGGTISMSYKGFDFRAMFQGVIGRDIEDGVFGTDGLRGGSNLLKRFLNRWTPDNQDTRIPRVAAGVRYNNSLFVGPSLSYHVNDASYVRMKHIELGYVLPADWIKKAGFSNVRLYVSGQNLLTFTNFVEGFDPEDKLAFNDVNDSYPQAKTISVGINLGF